MPIFSRSFGAWRAVARAACFAVIVVPTIIASRPALAELDGAMRVNGAVPQAMADTASIPAAPPVLARIDLSAQTMQIYVGDRLVNVFPVSTGRAGYATPPGDYRPQWLAAMWRSRKYNFAPMPWSVFFYGGYAIHGTTEVRNLGNPASHGCVRLHPENAKIFFQLVQKSGRENTTITIVR
jgi:lipoprotein-anchoring transpeptidase ErfK/SrfK